MRKAPKQGINIARHSKSKKPLVSKTLRLNDDHCNYVEKVCGLNLASWVRELMDRHMQDLENGK